MKKCQSDLKDLCKYFSAAQAEHYASRIGIKKRKLCEKDLMPLLSASGYAKRRCSHSLGVCCEDAYRPASACRWSRCVRRDRAVCVRTKPPCAWAASEAILPRRIRRCVRGLSRRICCRIPPWSWVRSDPYGHPCEVWPVRSSANCRYSHPSRPERTGCRIVSLRVSFCTAFPTRPADAGKIVVAVPDGLVFGF